MPGKLFVVATPIGNMEDLTLRALSTFKTVALIACEDTRHTAILLGKYEIHKPLVSYHQHSKITKLDFLLAELNAGKDIALVSDAGTPGLSDPGALLVAEAVKQNISVVPIPGVSAALALWQVSGIKDGKFVFYGFLPHKKGRQTMLKEILAEHKPVIIYESCHRINKLLAELGEREVIVGKELTKMFETILRGPANKITLEVPKGEYVVILCTAAPQQHAQP